MVRVLAAPRAELAQLELVLALPLVLRGGVVPLLAGGALERNDAAVTLRHDLDSSYGKRGRPSNDPPPGTEVPVLNLNA
jgi:hypothetical protein